MLDQSRPADAIRPWAWRSGVFPRDPDFRPKAGVVLDLYERRFQGRRLHPGDYVISADEKTQLQALLRRYPLVAPAAAGGVPLHLRRAPEKHEHAAQLVTGEPQSGPDALPDALARGDA